MEEVSYLNWSQGWYRCASNIQDQPWWRAGDDSRSPCPLRGSYGPICGCQEFSSIFCLLGLHDVLLVQNYVYLCFSLGLTGSSVSVIFILVGYLLKQWSCMEILFALLRYQFEFLDVFILQTRVPLFSCSVFSPQFYKSDEVSSQIRFVPYIFSALLLLQIRWNLLLSFHSSFYVCIRSVLFFSFHCSDIWE